jgi:aminoglycoside 6-adenylyltransferase
MGIEENWQAMWATIVLFRKLAISVGEALGYAYPKELDERMDRYLQNVRDYKMDADENSVSKG